MNSNKRGVPRWLILVVGYGISLACLFWVYRGYNWAEQLPRLLQADASWVTVAIAFNLCTYLIQGLRWSQLLKPVGTADALHTTQGIFIGLFANEVLPLRPGEVIRCYLVRRWSGLPLSVVLSSAGIERLVDGVILAAGLGAVGHFMTLPGILLQGIRALMVTLALMAGLMTAAIYYRSHTDAWIAQSRWKGTLLHIVKGVDAMGRSANFLWVVALSVAFMACQIIPIWALMQGFSLHLSPWAAVVVFVVLRLGTVLPVSPGNAGTFQASATFGLGLLGVGKDEATNYATLLFVVITVPLWLAGFVALMATRMRLDDIHQVAHAEPGHQSHD
jgi:glycosyltransferase 2 family protein